ncbi:MAG: type II secretion system protein [Lachnospiraceae bacterium]|nr:type II secretion system protein [Lachnospiraceae bacterium]
MKKFKNDNKGFTLVELIVVLVILAILAAILVPALLGYIDEAKQKQIVLEGKSVYTAAQAVASEMYAKDDSPENIANYSAKIIKMADIDTTAVTKISIGFSEKYVSTATTHGMWTVNYIAYEKGTDKIYLTGGSWEATDSQTGTNGVKDLTLSSSTSTSPSP